MGERERATVDKVDNRQQQRAADERKHQLDLAKLEANKAVRLAKVAGNFPESSRNVPEPLQVVPETSGKAATWRKLTVEDKRHLYDLSASEAASEFKVSERTARNWKARLNGVAK